MWKDKRRSGANKQQATMGIKTKTQNTRALVTSVRICGEWNQSTNGQMGCLSSRPQSVLGKTRSRHVKQTEMLPHLVMNEANTRNCYLSWWKKNRFCCCPIFRWSRFLACIEYYYCHKMLPKVVDRWTALHSCLSHLFSKFFILAHSLLIRKCNAVYLKRKEMILMVQQQVQVVKKKMESRYALHTLCKLSFSAFPSQ